MIDGGVFQELGLGGGGVRIRFGGVILLGIGTRGLVWFEGVRFGRSD